MKKLEEKRKFAIGVALLVITVLFYFRMLLFPLIGKYRQVGETIAQYKRELAITDAGIARMDEVLKDIQRLERVVGQAQQHFPSEKELPILLEELSRVAEKSGVKIVEITPGGNAAQPVPATLSVKGLRELPIVINAMSGYHEFGNFVNALENSERVYLIRDIAVRSHPENERIHSVELVVSIFLTQEGFGR